MVVLFSFFPDNEAVPNGYDCTCDDRSWQENIPNEKNTPDCSNDQQFSQVCPNTAEDRIDQDNQYGNQKEKQNRQINFHSLLCFARTLIQPSM